MKHLYFRRTLPWHLPIKSKRKETSGVMTVVTLFMFFVFSTLGLSMLYLSQIHLKLSGHKKNSILLDYASENGIKQGFCDLAALLSQAPQSSILSTEELEELKKDVQERGVEPVEKILGSPLPLVSSETWEKLSWESRTDFCIENILEKEDYFKATYNALIHSQGKIENFKQKKESTLKASIGLLAGNIPLPYIPLLIDKKLKPEEKENFKEENEIEFIPSKLNLLKPQMNFPEEEILPKRADSQLTEALNIKIFYPQNLSNQQLRAALGLDETDEPVPEGVYLVKDDLGLRGIYVQGDLEEMVMAVEDDFQVVSFVSGQGSWTLKFSPKECTTVFRTPEETISYDLIPLGIIIVDGEIRSLGGGEVNPFGEVVLEKNEEIPCIHQGVNLTIISSHKITISSHLIHQGVKWTDGVPYVKDSNSQLNIFSTGSDFWDNTQRDGNIVIDENSPDEIKIQASLTASGKGFSIEGAQKTVHLLGSLQISDYESNQNALKITLDDQIMKENNSPQNAPQTTKPVFCLSFFRVLEWEEI
jgi:hypothetical protein